MRWRDADQIGKCCKVFLQAIAECTHWRQHTSLIIEPMRADYHSFHNLSIFSQIEFTRQITQPDYKGEGTADVRGT